MADEIDQDSHTETPCTPVAGEVEDGAAPSTALVQIADELAVLYASVFCISCV